MFEQMAQIFASEQSKEFSSSLAVPGDLKIDKGRPTIGELKPVRLLGQIIVDDAATTHPLQERMCLTKIPRVVWARLLHGRTRHETAVENGSIPDEQLWNMLDPAQRAQNSCLARGRSACDPAQAKSRGSHIATDPATIAVYDDLDAAQRIGLEEFGMHAAIIAEFACCGPGKQMTRPGSGSNDRASASLQ